MLKEESKGSKLIIFVDENLYPLQEHLSTLGYAVKTLPQSTSDDDIIAYLLQIKKKVLDKPIVLVTANTKDFPAKYFNRNLYRIGCESRPSLKKLALLLDKYFRSELYTDYRIMDIERGRDQVWNLGSSRIG